MSAILTDHAGAGPRTSYGTEDWNACSSETIDGVLYYLAPTLGASISGILMPFELAEILLAIWPVINGLPAPTPEPAAESV
ncbi:hypothetical protein KQI65_10330 [bacterium]|nr:hypothetical protein [bacterium]